MSYERINLLLAAVGGSILTILTVMINPVGYWVYPIFYLISVPLPLRKDIYSIWGGACKGNVVSIFGLYQDAGRDALSLAGVCFFQRARFDAYQMFTVCLNQQAGRDAVHGFGFSYRQFAVRLACHFLVFGIKQTSHMKSEHFIGVLYHQHIRGDPYRWFSFCFKKTEVMD